MPFTVTPPGAVSAKAQTRQEEEHEQASDFTTMAGGNHSITAADARAMRNSQAYVPLDMEEADIMLSSYVALLAALLGYEHPCVKAHHSSRSAYRSVRPHLKRILSERLGTQLAAATMVYYYHAKHRHWFVRQWRLSMTHTAPPPTLGLAFDAFAEGYNLSWLPNTSHVDVLRLLERAPESPRHVVPPGTPDPASPQRERVRNPQADPRYFGDTPLALALRSARIKDLVIHSSAPIPEGETGPRCLSWHVKGACYKDCLRKSDHVILRGAAKEQLFDWIKAALE